LFDEALPIEVRELPADLAVLDALLSDPGVLEPVERAWDRAARGHGRPTIPIERFVRLMVIEQRTGWGYEMLAREVSDSLHLRRFCLIALTERVPDESTIRKLCRRLGPDVIEEICRPIIAGVVRERRFCPRGADRLDRRRGRRSLPVRSWAGGRRDQDARARGGEDRRTGRRRRAAC
jgi:IS5 family transposase